MTRFLAASFAGCVLCAGLAGPALAYVGPGVGLSLLGALWALLLAVLAAVAFVVAWPLSAA